VQKYKQEAKDNSELQNARETLKNRDNEEFSGQTFKKNTIDTAEIPPTTKLTDLIRLAVLGLFKLPEGVNDAEAIQHLEKFKVLGGKLCRHKTSLSIGRTFELFTDYEEIENRGNYKHCQSLGKGSDSFFKIGASAASNYFCCFSSRLAYIIQTDKHGRQSLRPFGNGEAADCSGLTLAEFEKLDLDKINFSWLEDELKAKFGDIDSDKVQALLQNLAKGRNTTDPNNPYEKMLDEDIAENLLKEQLRNENFRDKSALESIFDWLNSS
jgi:hypothetical protein